MKYTFKQIPRRNRKKLLWNILGTSVIFLFLGFVTIYLCSSYALPEGLTIISFLVAFFVPAGISIVLFTRKYSVLRIICVTEDSIVITETTPYVANEQSALDSVMSRTYTLSPAMIRNYRYVSGSDEANHLHISTYNTEYEVIVPEPMKNNVAFHLLKSALEKWVKDHGVQEHTN